MFREADEPPVALPAGTERDWRVTSQEEHGRGLNGSRV